MVLQLKLLLDVEPLTVEETIAICDITGFFERQLVPRSSSIWLFNLLPCGYFFDCLTFSFSPLGKRPKPNHVHERLVAEETELNLTTQQPRFSNQ